MNRQWMTAAGAGILVSSSWTFAAQVVQDFEVSVSIPTQSFYVIPSEPDWIYREQILPWNIQTSTLGALRKNFDVYHDAGGIDARLEQIPLMSNGKFAQDFLLEVSFNGHNLSERWNHWERVISAEEARTGKRVALEIRPRRPYKGFSPGNYYGSVLIVFAAAAP